MTILLTHSTQTQSITRFFCLRPLYSHLYKNTIVLVVGLVSQIVTWFDRFIIDGAVNFVGLVTVFSGQSLKYNATGQTQFYFLTIILGIGFLVTVIGWPIFSNLSLP